MEILGEEGGAQDGTQYLLTLPTIVMSVSARLLQVWSPAQEWVMSLGGQQEKLQRSWALD